jgi:HAD superfamily hydrolase (TIGR01549 family)
MAELDLVKEVKGKKAVILDLDNTLYAYDPCHKVGLNAVYKLYSDEIESISRKEFDSQYEQAKKSVKTRTKNQAASHSRLLYFKEMLEIQYRRSFLQASKTLEKAYWNAFFEKMKLEAWVMPFLKYLHAQEIAAIIVTDLTLDIQIQKIRKLKLDQWIRYMVTSEEAGVEKPDPKIFKLALAKVSCKPSQAIGIGDDPKKDCWPEMSFLLIQP